MGAYPIWLRREGFVTEVYSHIAAISANIKQS
jgi:hypothetical protein